MAWLQEIISAALGWAHKHPCLVFMWIIFLPFTGPITIVADLFIFVNLLWSLLLVTPFILASCCCCCFCGEKSLVYGFAGAWAACGLLFLIPIAIVLALALYPVTVAVAIVVYCRFYNKASCCASDNV